MRTFRYCTPFKAGVVRACGRYHAAEKVFKMRFMPEPIIDHYVMITDSNGEINHFRADHFTPDNGVFVERV